MHAHVRLPRGLALLALVATLLPTGLFVPAQASASSTAPLTCERIPQLVEAYFQKHISYGYLNEEIRSRAVDAYLRRIDPSKTLLLAPEAEALRASLMGIFHDVYSGDCTRLEVLQKDLVGRYDGMEKFAREMVAAESYAVDPEVMLVIDPEKRGYPANDEERRALWAKLVHFHMTNYLNAEEDVTEAKRKLTHRYELMGKRARELEKEDVYAVFLDSFATSLDPHSHYLSAEVLEDFQIDMRLSLDGIGVALSSRDGYSVVEKIIPGGATDKLDVLQPKDKVIAVAQEDLQFVDVIDMDLRDVVRLIRGKRNTKVHLKILRQSEATERFTVTIVRDKIDLEERSAKLRVEEIQSGDKTYRLGIIDLPSFYGDRNPSKRQSSRDLRMLLAQVKEQKCDGLLLDLSRNGGGLLETAVEIAGFFIPEGGVVAVKGTEPKVQVLDDPDESILYDGPMVVLTSRVSASASEIVAGALKDYRRAVVVGDDHTFGKGTVQSMVPLPPGLGALKVTTALFFRPGGQSTQHEGVISDIVLPSLIGGDDYGEKHQRYSLPAQQIAPFLEGGEAAAPSPRKRPWPTLTTQVVSELQRRSAVRVNGDEQFAEIAKQLEEVEKRDGMIHLAEILEEREQEEQQQQEATAQRESASAAGDVAVSPPPKPSEKGDEELTSPQQDEALRILADLVALST